MENTKQAVANSVEEFPVNHKAERLLDIIAGVYLVLAWIIGALAILIGIIVSIQENDPTYIILCIIGGAVQVLIGYIVWAALKTVVNISNNLYNINAKITDRQ